LLLLNGLYKFFILPFYKVLLRLKKIIINIIGPVNTTYLIPFINRYVSHGIIIIITISILFLNYQVKETRAENFGEKSILYAIVQGEDLNGNFIEESANNSPDTAKSYFANDFLINSQIAQKATSDSSIISTKETNALTTITQGDAVTPTGITSIEASKKKRDKIINYVVKEGDTVSAIASKFGLSTNTILWANNMTSRTYLKPRQNLDIPPINGLIYIIKKGDTIKAIAKKYDSDEKKIIEFNKLADASDISVKQILMLPNGRPYRAPIPRRPSKLAPVRNTGSRPTNISNKGLIWPTTTRRISQYYSWRHTGLDIDGEFGDLIWASGAGKVILVRYLNYDYGYHVVIDHGNRIQTLYAHMQRIYVKKGQKVNQGDLLGEMGSTGRSTGSHLHFEVRVNGRRVNPFAWVKR